VEEEEEEEEKDEEDAEEEKVADEEHIQRRSSACSQYRPCQALLFAVAHVQQYLLGVGWGRADRLVDVDGSVLAVAAHVKIESKTWKHFIIV
jgi:hypothetical protein